MTQKHPKRPRDPNQLAKFVVDVATCGIDEMQRLQAGVIETSPSARRGGLKGGPARAEKLTPERKREIALKAARARWGSKDDPSKK